MNIYLDLFLTFAKVGVCTFGGGYAMLPILQREVVEKKGWAPDEELTDYLSSSRSSPPFSGILRTAPMSSTPLTASGPVSAC